MRADVITVTISIDFSEFSEENAVNSVTEILSDSFLSRIDEGLSERNDEDVKIA